MTNFMELELLHKGTTYCVDCAHCGAILYTHEWAYIDHNERRDAMMRGTLRCAHCGKQIAGYLDCTEWEFGTNKRELVRQVQQGY